MQIKCEWPTTPSNTLIFIQNRRFHGCDSGQICSDLPISNLSSVTQTAHAQ
uniref:Uncharacterized protein n=1 Tax=Anguilla anguilla TaxID=7936 RepID=A0A0E9QK78_ANGAN